VRSRLRGGNGGISYVSRSSSEGRNHLEMHPRLSYEAIKKLLPHEKLVAEKNWHVDLYVAVDEIRACFHRERNLLHPIPCRNLFFVNL
jgi:hypothetical protein